MTKRYTIELPDETYNRLKHIADEEETTVASQLRKGAQLLLYIRSIKADPGTRLLIERAGKNQELVLDLI